MERAGVPAISTHDLRHIAATIMLQGGTPGAVVSQKIGHSSYATTVDIYGHVMPSEQAQANAAIDAYLARGN
jgi:integrase